MIVVNLTGLSRIYWLPKVGHQTDHAGLWYWDLRWLGVEIIVYSREMGAAFIFRMNRDQSTTEARDGTSHPAD